MNCYTGTQVLIIHESLTRENSAFSILNQAFKLKVSSTIQVDSIIYPKEKLAILFIKIREDTSLDCLIKKICAFEKNHANCLVHFVVEELGQLFQKETIKLKNALSIFNKLVLEFIENHKIQMSLFSSEQQAAEFLVNYSTEDVKWLDKILDESEESWIDKQVAQLHKELARITKENRNKNSTSKEN